MVHQQIFSLKHKLFARPVQRYIVVGGSIYVVELMVIIVLQRLGASPLVAVAVSFWTGLLLSFVLQKLITFQDKRRQRHILVRQILAFSVLVLCNFLFTLLVAQLLSPYVPPTVTRTLALGMTTLWNYYLYKTRIFRPVADENVVY
ncbi:MAG: hypothetical protein NVS1B7_5070 [Candidatus Saccharimonadales bacterium]